MVVGFITTYAISANAINFNLNKFYCQIYTIGLNTSFATYMKFSPVSCKHNAIIEVKGDNHTLFKIWMHITALEDQEKDEDDNSGEISTGIMAKMFKKREQFCQCG